MNKQLIALCVTGLTLLVANVVTSAVQAESNPLEPACDVETSAWCIAPRVEQSLSDLSGATVPRIATPLWLSNQEQPPAHVVNYSVKTRGAVSADLAEFKRQTNETLNDSRGWAKLGVSFRETEEEGDFTLWIAEASSMTTFSAAGCDTTYSCAVGRDVIINQDRWLGATPSWNGTDGSLRDYRHMVVNHEVGHWLGHGHRFCEQSGAAAPVMQQQSMDMQGCQPNPWPLSSELYAPMIGIRS